MKKVNVKDLSLNIDIVQILNLFATNKKIMIDLDGEIHSELDKDFKKPIIFSLDNNERKTTILDAKALASNIFADYKPELAGTTCKIKLVHNWQKIIDMNKNSMLYFDHQSDGVELFEDAILEDYGWHANSVSINYREIADFIEENCEGTLLCYDNEIQFSGFVIINDILDVREKVKSYIKTKALENLKNDLIDIDDDDVQEAFEFFKIEA